MNKFRVWDKLNNRFVKGRFIDQNGLVYDWVGGVNVIELEPEPDKWPGSDGKSVYVVQKFTGKYDSKGEEIYEGDIIYYRYKLDEHGPTYEEKGEVFWDDECAAFLFDRINQFSWLDTHFFHDSIKIVGNILENGNWSN